MNSSVANLSLPINERDYVLGSINAPVTLVEYGDYECPHCKCADQIVQEMQKCLGSKLRFVFRNFPLTKIHNHAQYVAEVAAAAGAQNRFWEMHDYLFEHQQVLGNGLLYYAAAYLGLDVDRFEREIAEHVYAEQVRQDWNTGVASGVNGTPTFFINNLRFDGKLEMLFAVVKEASNF